MRWDPSNAEIVVYTFKEGLLSTFGHDLEIRATRFVIEGDEGTRRGEARIEAGALRVVGAVYDGVTKADALSDNDKRSIEDDIFQNVLDVDDHPEIRFVALRVDEHGDEVLITGELSLHGVTRPLAMTARHKGDRWVADVPLHQPDFGITPFRAFLGSLRIKPDVRVHVSAIDPR
jgi:hypothetical protein